MRLLPARSMAFSKSEYKNFGTRISRMERIFSFFTENSVISVASVYLLWFLSSDNEKAMPPGLRVFLELFLSFKRSLFSCFYLASRWAPGDDDWRAC